MTSVNKRWTSEHQRLLRQARVDAGVSEATLARDNTMTMRQLQQLEQGGSSAFYSESIQHDMGLKLLRRLGVPASALEALSTPPPADASPVTLSQARSPAALTATARRDDEPQVAPARSGVVPWRGWWVLIGVGLLGAGVVLSWWPDAPAPNTLSVTHPVPSDVVLSPASPPPRMPDPVSASTPVTAPAETAAREACMFQATPVAVTPSQPSKPADYVYLVAVSDVVLCMQDATGRQTRMTLQAGRSFNWPGRPPFDLVVDQPSQLRVFFQGQRIDYPPEAASLRLQATVTPP